MFVTIVPVLLVGDVSRSTFKLRHLLLFRKKIKAFRGSNPLLRAPDCLVVRLALARHCDIVLRAVVALGREVTTTDSRRIGRKLLWILAVSTVPRFAGSSLQQPTKSWGLALESHASVVEVGVEPRLEKLI